MGLDQQFNQQLHKYLQQLNKHTQPASSSLSRHSPYRSPYSYDYDSLPEGTRNLITKLIKSQNCHSWEILREVLATIQRQDEDRNKYKYSKVVQFISKNIQHVQNFVTLMYLYWFKIVNKSMYFGIRGWDKAYKFSCIQNNQINMFSLWIQSQPNTQIVQSSLNLVVDVFPNFYKNEYITMTEIQINCIIQWVTYYHTPSSLQYENISNLVKLTKQTPTILEQDYTEKQHVILKKLIDITGKAKQCSPNVFLFIYPFMMKQKDISYFCHLYSQQLQQMDEQPLCNFFSYITKSAVSQQIINIIFKISRLLKNQEQYYKLRFIYEKFILPELARRAKTCTKAIEKVFQLCQFYVFGFLNHCDIGENGLNCLIKNIGKISNQRFKQRWCDLVMAYCSQNQQYRQYALQNLKKQLGRPPTKQLINLTDLLNDRQIIWDVTVRNGKKLKVYQKKPSKMKGIVNQMSQCYIITVVQALHKGQFLEELAAKYKDKSTLLGQLNVLFCQLSGVRQEKNIFVKYLKSKGPEYFRLSQRQQDAYQYMIQLFSSIENQFKKVPQLFKQFKQTYEIEIQTTTTCQKCENKITIKQKSYSFTIPHTQILQQETNELLPDYQCQKCHAVGPSMFNQRVQPSSKILIVHINRFSHVKGIVKKQLSTQTILRRFLNYTLVGMICHLGKNVEMGHYVYYHRLDDRTWALFNDQVVEQFCLEHDNQQFQRQWKLQMTPFILFYQRLNQ